jgi:hypothetical protein
MIFSALESAALWYTAIYMLPWTVKACPLSVSITIFVTSGTGLECASVLLGLDWIGSMVGSSPVQEKSIGAPGAPKQSNLPKTEI